MTLEESDVGTASRPSAARRAVFAIAFGAVGAVVASRSARWVSVPELGARWGRVPAGCYELDHCGLSPWWTVGAALVVVGLPAIGFAVAGWRASSRAGPLVLLRAVLLLSAGTVAYHLGCAVLFVLVAYR